MGDMNTNLNRLPQLSPTPLWKLFEPSGSAPVGGGVTIPADSLALSGGAVPTANNGMSQQQYAQFVSDTIAMLNNPDPRQRFQAIINMTKMNPQEAIPLLQQAEQNDNPQVVQLAQKALSAMQQMPGATATPMTPTAIGPTAASPVMATPTTPAMPSPGVPGAIPAVPGAPVLQTPAVPTVASPMSPAMPTVATPMTPAAPTMPNGQAPDFNQLLMTYKTAYDPAVKAQTLLQMEACAGANRQAVVNTMLATIDMHQFPIPSDQEQEAAISVLRDLKAPEAVPFLQNLQSNMANSDAVRQAAGSALQVLQAGSGLTGADPNTQFTQLQMQLKGATDPAMKAQILLQMEASAGANRQAVVNTMLATIDMHQFPIPSDQEQEAAISVLRDLRAPEAVPFLQNLQSNMANSDTLRQAAGNALQALQAAPQTTAMPQTAAYGVPQAAPAYGVPQTAPAYGVPQAAPAQTNLPGFLR